MTRKKRRIHVCPPATASEIIKALRITRADIKAAEAAVAEALGRKGKRWPD